MRLYDLELSGNCYKVRLFCALIGLPIEIAPVDFMAGAHKRPEFLELNPFGELPVLEDGDLVLRDSQAILVYLAKKHGARDWLPDDPGGLARVVQWLSTAANDVARGLNDARLHDKFGYDLDCGRARDKAHRVLGLLEAHLAARDWLELGRPTLADVACYPMSRSRRKAASRSKPMRRCAAGWAASGRCPVTCRCRVNTRRRETPADGGMTALGRAPTSPPSCPPSRASTTFVGHA